MTTLGSSLSSAHEEDSSSLIICEPCNRGGKVTCAIGMCVTCEENLCQGCYDIHKLPKPCQNHQLIQDMCTEKCPHHRNEAIHFYCTGHRLLACNICEAIHHKNCKEKDKRFIPHVATKLDTDTIFTETGTRLKGINALYEDIEIEVKRKTDQITTESASALDMVRDFRQEILTALDKLESEILTKLDELKECLFEEIRRIQDNCLKHKSRMHTVHKMTEKLKKDKQFCNLYTFMMQNRDEIDKMTSVLKQAEIDISDTDCHIEFIPNISLLNTLGQRGMLGKVPSCFGQTIEDIIPLGDIPVKAKEDKSVCFITGITFFSEKVAILADRNNGNLKALNTDDKRVTDVLSLTSCPWDVAKLNSTQFVVTLPREKKLAFVNIGYPMALEKGICVNGDCYGIDSDGDRLAISYCNPHKIKILDLQGTELRTLEQGSNGKPLFDYPHYLSFDKSGSVYVSNYGSNKIIHMDLDGNMMAVYEDNDLSRPLKVTSNSYGDAFVCGRDSNNIHQITSGCKKVRVVLNPSNGIAQPYCVSYNDKSGMMLIGQKQNDVIKVCRIIWV